MKTLSGHLTATNKSHIQEILSQNLTEGRVNSINYYLEKQDNTYTVKIEKKDRGLIPCGGSELRMRSTKHTFEI